jgi:hypothetical protein
MYPIFALFFFQIELLPTNPSMVKFISALQPPHPNSNRKQYPQGKGKKLVPSHLNFSLGIHYDFFQLKSSHASHQLCCDNPVCILSSRHHFAPPHTNSNRKQGTGQVRICFHFLFHTFLSSLLI